MNLNALTTHDLTEIARLKSGELATLLEFINEADTDRQANADCPDYINDRTLGVVLAAARDVAELLNTINEEMADRMGGGMHG